MTKLWTDEDQRLAATAMRRDVCACGHYLSRHSKGTCWEILRSGGVTRYCPCDLPE